MSAAPWGVLVLACLSACAVTPRRSVSGVPVVACFVCSVSIEVSEPASGSEVTLSDVLQQRAPDYAEPPPGVSALPTRCHE